MERRIKHSYTNSYTKNQLAKVDRKEFQKWIRSAQKADFVIAGSIKFGNLIAGRIKTVIHIVIQKSSQNTKKPQQKHFYCGFLWCHRESNQGHKDFQSFALPTEL